MNITSTILVILAIYYVAMNIALFVMMGMDKSFATKGKWRIPEATLFTMAILGGCIGGIIGMNVFRHKTKKPAFHIIYIGSLVLHVLLWVFVISKLIK